ncbi:LysR family transcriptional regulator [Gemella cuniculi]|uniref:LysR family transcriptional regulator n=1 Tax=Gemella cuniculi TaxID=150240 RepID=UPI00041FEA18|nr:LysR family transcriptional regulator [Gemella cuniculi]
MELRVLNYFLTVATEKNITRAAEVLHISQPALSKQLKDLEEELDVSLFSRGARSITLTEDGIYFLEKTKEILSLVDTTISNISSNNFSNGELNIGGGESIQFQKILKIISKLKKDNINIKVNITSANADDILPKLDSGLLDFALIVGFIDKNKYNHLTLPWAHTWGILINKEHPLAKKRFVTPKDLKNSPLIISKQSHADSFIASWLNSNIENFNIVGTYNLIYNASLMVKENLGIALTLDGLINTNNTNIKFIPLETKLETELSIIWKKNYTLSKTAQKFLKKLKEELNNYK